MKITISEKEIKELFLIIWKLNQKSNKIEEVIKDSTDSLFGEVIDGLTDLILTLLKIPEDNTVEMCEKYGTDSLSDLPDEIIDTVFCRDDHFDLLFDALKEKDKNTAWKMFLELWEK